MNVLEFNTIYSGLQVSAITMVTFLITRCLWGRGVRVWPSLAGTDWPLSDSSGHRMSGWQPRHKLRCFLVSGASSPTHSLWSGRADNSDVSAAQIRMMTARHRCLSQRKVGSHHPSSGINRDVKRRGIYRLVASERARPESVSWSCDGPNEIWESQQRVSLTVTAREQLLFILFSSSVTSYFYALQTDSAHLSFLCFYASLLMRALAICPSSVRDWRFSELRTGSTAWPTFALYRIPVFLHHDN